MKYVVAAAKGDLCPLAPSCLIIYKKGPRLAQMIADYAISHPYYNFLGEKEGCNPQQHLHPSTHVSWDTMVYLKFLTRPVSKRTLQSPQLLLKITKTKISQ